MKGEAERVASRIQVHPESLRIGFSRRSSRAQRQHRLLGNLNVINQNVHVQLLSSLRITPHRRSPFTRTLKRELPHAGPQSNHDSIRAVLIDPHPQDLRVKRRKSARVRAIENRLLQRSNHSNPIP